MKKYKKGVLFILLLAIALAVCGCAFGGNKKIGKRAALQIALEDAGLTAAEAVDVDIDWEKSFSTAWYEVSFEAGRMEYEYKINAYTGDILSAITD